MSANQQRPEPLDLGEYEKNRSDFPPEELAKYAGMFIAFRADGRAVVGHGETEEALDEMLLAKGIPLNQVVYSYVDPLEA